MNKILQGVLSILAVFALMYSLNAIANFFDIDPSNYMIFLLFLGAMGIFYAVLPGTRGDAFSL